MLQSMFKNNVWMRTTSFCFSHPIMFAIALSWLYAIASQIAIPLPFNLVPLSLQPLPVLLCAYFFEKTAVYAYVFYLMQGAVGLPFFSHARGGLPHLLGPTGGYLIGFLLAMMFVVWCKSVGRKSRTILFMLGCCAVIIYFTAGLIQLSFFVSGSSLLSVGLFPFIVGDFIKIFVWFVCARKNR